MTTLTEKSCQVCEGGVPALSTKEAAVLLANIPHWEILPSGKEIKRAFQFKNFYHTMAFVNAIAWIANQEGHHPDLEIGYNYCHVRYSTHAVNGLTENDFICAAKIDKLQKNPPNLRS
jgi:4a-hydroxytetrahydrobiopterin dehydratase